MQGLINAFLFSIAWIFVVVFTLGIGLIAVPVYWFFVIRNADVRAVKAEEKLGSALMKGESVIDKGLQKRLYALSTRRQLIAITNSRIVLISRSIFGGFSMKDYQWKDLRDAQLTENVLPDFCGSKLSFIVNKSQTGIVIDGLPSNVASVIYSHAQTQEQEWEEKNRIRLLEEKRAASGASVVNVGEASRSGPKGDSIFENLEKAKRLLDSGVISDSEYQELKSKILNGGAL